MPGSQRGCRWPRQPGSRQHSTAQYALLAITVALGWTSGIDAGRAVPMDEDKLPGEMRRSNLNCGWCEWAYARQDN